MADNTVDINLKVKEKGKNSIGLNGGVSGLAGAFVGLKYETNNFLGIGRNADSCQLRWAPTSATSMFGFTEPYLFDKPIQTGFTAYYRTFKYNQAQQAEHLLHPGGDGDPPTYLEFAAELFAVEHGLYALEQLCGAALVQALRP